jgi:Anti-sigma-K factor rskA
MGAMDHQDIRELLEDAATEPHGLERLMAGDTPNAAIVAGHLAACPDCAEELARLHRAVGLIAPVIRALPPPELRDRTLARIAAVGRQRPGAGIDRAAPTRDLAPQAPDGDVGAPPTPIRRRAVRGPLIGLAAALILAVAGAGLLIAQGRDAEAVRQGHAVEALGHVARWTLRVDAQPDVRRVDLASPTGSDTRGTIVYSPSSQELIIVADELTPPPAGREYRCWIEVRGSRKAIGKMFFGGDLAYWVGDVPEIAGIGPDVTFGVSLVDLSGTAPGEPVLTGS